tara:strand:+ start:1595 stop:2155 length:561 start_codon:yes stop_codon:yes gene_type:complete
MAFSFTSKGFNGFNGNDPGLAKKIRMNILSINPLFRKTVGDDNQGYPFLNSRFFTSDPGMKNPMSGGGGGPRTKSKDEKFTIEKTIKSYYGGNYKMRQSAEKQAKQSFKTWQMLNQNLYKASNIFEKNPLKANTLFKESIDKAYELHRNKIGGADYNIAVNNAKMIKKFASGFLAPQVEPLFRSYR